MSSRVSARRSGGSTHPAHRDALEEHLARYGLKWTRQREAILEIFLRTKGHFTAEEVHARVARLNAKIGYSTVYRTLRLFVQAKVASERHFRDGLTRYEVRQAHHDHLVCVQCGKILEFERADIEALQEEVAAQHGFTLQSHRHELYGTCRNCSEAESPSK